MERAHKAAPGSHGTAYSRLERRQLDRRKKSGKPSSPSKPESRPPQWPEEQQRYTTDPDHFQYINERPVDEISLRFFYSPHTVTLLVCSVSFLVYVALTRWARSFFPF